MDALKVDFRVKDMFKVDFGRVGGCRCCMAWCDLPRLVSCRYAVSVDERRGQSCRRDVWYNIIGGERACGLGTSYL